jgi:hypothetical protein
MTPLMYPTRVYGQYLTTSYSTKVVLDTSKIRFLSQNMSPNLASCVLCGAPIGEQDSTWLSEFRASLRPKPIPVQQYWLTSSV